MHRIKSLIFVTCLVAGLTLSLWALSRSDTFESSHLFQEAHNDLREVFNERLSNAEESLGLSVGQMASDATLVGELADVRQRLMSHAPDELKRQTNNLWNKRVFDRLLSLGRLQGSKMEQSNAKLSHRLKADSGHALSLYPKGSWWSHGPDLLLAFANVPLKDDDVSSILLAYAAEGKQLRAGKRYDEEMQLLRDLQVVSEKKITLLAWDGKMYIAVLEPVVDAGVNIATLVVGMELSRELVASFSRKFSEGLQLMAYYAKPKLDCQSKSNVLRRYYSNHSDAERLDIEKAEYFLVNGDKSEKTTHSLEQIESGKVYTSRIGEKQINIARLRWIWDDSQEAGFYFVSDIAAVQQPLAQLSSYILWIGLLFWLVSMVGVAILVGVGQRDANRIKAALIEAIDSGEAIDPAALALLPGMQGLNIGSYCIHFVEEPLEGNQEDWEALVMHVDDDSKDDASDDAGDAGIAEEEARQLYTEYMRLRGQLGLSQDMEFKKFSRRLRRNAEKIKRQYKVKKVSFEPQIDNGKVVLKPKIVSS